MPVDTASIRRFLLARLGEPTPQPTEAGLWMVHEFTGEPYFVVVQPGPSEDALHYRQTPNTSGEWLRLQDSWPTVEYPDLDIACWRFA